MSSLRNEVWVMALLLGLTMLLNKDSEIVIVLQKEYIMDYDKIRRQELIEQYETDAQFRTQYAELQEAFLKAFVQAQKSFDGGKGALPDIHYIIEQAKSGFSEDVVEYFVLEGRARALK